MIDHASMPRLKGFRFPREVVAYADWAYHRFASSAADVEDLLAQRGVTVSREAVRLWVNRFSAHFAACIRRGSVATISGFHFFRCCSNGLLLKVSGARGRSMIDFKGVQFPKGCCHVNGPEVAGSLIWA